MHDARYVQTILDRANASHFSTSPVPFHPNLKLSKEMCPKTDEEKAFMADISYRTIIGMLLYLMVSSRPDIAYAVCTCARYMDCPGKEHWNAVCGILKYLKGTIDLRITYSSTIASSHPILHGYSDADWAANDLDTRHSHTGYVFYLSNGPIAWKSCLQSSISLSSMDSEYSSMGDATKEMLELREVHHEVNKLLPSSVLDRPTTIYADKCFLYQTI